MNSIQANLLFLYIRLQRLISPQPKEFDLEKERADMEAISKMFKALAEFKNQAVEVNGVPGEWITPALFIDGRTILFLHGGYYLFGSIQSHRSLAGNIATASQARALIIDYRLAPEHPFPAALEDALTAYRWLLAQNIRPDQITLVGDSAGGGLAVATMLALRDQAEPLPAAAVCMSPVMDLTLSGESWTFNAKKDIVIRRSIAEQTQILYLRGTDPSNPLASPLFADLHGLPPVFIQVGSNEFLLSDAKSFARFAQRDGVDITLEVWPGLLHVWQFTASFVPEARQAILGIGEFIKSISQKSEATTAEKNPAPRADR
jgi:monoterpene epsilon-lactone hydrolase